MRGWWSMVSQPYPASLPGRKRPPHPLLHSLPPPPFPQDRTISRLTEMQSLEYLIAHAKQYAPENLLALQVSRASRLVGSRGERWGLGLGPVWHGGLGDRAGGTGLRVPLPWESALMLQASHATSGR